MNNLLRIGNLTLGDGIPKICVPIVAEDRTELEKCITSLSQVPFDMAEFRADCYAPLREACLTSAFGRTGLLGNILEDILPAVREALKGKPLLFTVRTAAEGGKVSLSFSEYRTLLLQAAQTGCVDLVDVELFTADQNAADLTGKLHDLNVKVIGSSHDFLRTPPEAEMLRRLLAMQSLGMDVTKLAVMPQNRGDVLSLLKISCEMADGKADRPFVTMAMGPLGAVSRLGGGLTGSAITFASVAGAASAPGQLDAALVRQVLEVTGGDRGTCTVSPMKRLNKGETRYTSPCLPYQITGTTRLGGLLGSPVAHSKSPLMHNESFQLLGLDCVYLCFDMGPENLGRTVQTLRDMNVYGFNLTMPLKTAVIPFLDALSEEAELIGAVNTVKNEEGRFVGYNTDGMGFMKSVRDQGMDVAGKTVTLLGAGGAASAVAVQAALDGAGVLHLVSRRGRSWERAADLVRRIREKTACLADLTDLADTDVLARHLSESDLLINATSVGMEPDVNVSPIADPAMLPPSLLVGDVIYHPARTLLLRQAGERGCRTFNGMDMLLYQGAAAFRIWTGQDMPVEKIRAKFFRKEG